MPPMGGGMAGMPGMPGVAKPKPQYKIFVPQTQSSGEGGAGGGVAQE